MSKPNRLRPPASVQKTADRPPIQPTRAKPVAPPAYRPQPIPKVLQRKSSPAQPPAPAAQQATATRQTPAAPPVYRPQPPSRLVQPKQPPGANQPTPPRPLRLAETNHAARPGGHASKLSPRSNANAVTAQPKANTVVPARVNSVVQPSAARGAASTTPVSAGRVSVRPSSVVQLATFNTVNDVTAGIPARIRANNTPDAMPDRIPPRVDTPTRLLIHGWRIPMAPLRVRVAGCSQQNGVVTVNGQAEARISADCYLQLRGVTQTQPGHAGNLMLEVLLSEGSLLARSDGFSVAAIPQNWSVTGCEPTDVEGFVGLDIQDEWESDSGRLGDLDEVQITEVMETVTKTGCCMGLPERDSGYIIAHEVSIDAHAILDEYMTGPGRWVVNQTHAFRDRRTGANGISITRSGYRITLEVKKKPSSSAYQVTVTKEGAALTVRGVSSGAGAGIISQTVG